MAIMMPKDDDGDDDAKNDGSDDVLDYVLDDDDDNDGDCDYVETTMMISVFKMIIIVFNILPFT